MYRTQLKNVSNAIEANDKETALETLANAVRVLDKMVSKGIVNKNKAARHKSRLSGQVGSLVMNPLWARILFQCENP